MSLPNNSTFKLKVLLVEDGPLALLAEKMCLERMGCSVDVASTGEQALELCLKNIYDLILMDLELGNNVDGFTVTKEIKSQPTKNATIPVIALTSHLSESYKTRAKEAGMNDFLVKPLAEDFIQIIFDKYFSQDVPK